MSNRKGASKYVESGGGGGGVKYDRPGPQALAQKHLCIIMFQYAREILWINRYLAGLYNMLV